LLINCSITGYKRFAIFFYALHEIFRLTEDTTIYSVFIGENRNFRGKYWGNARKNEVKNACLQMKHLY